MKSSKTKLTTLEARRKAFYKLVEAPDSEPVELMRVGLRAASAGEETTGGEGARNRASYRIHAARYCLKNRKDVAKIYENPLDDYEKLQAVRRLVFGSAPESDP